MKFLIIWPDGSTSEEKGFNQLRGLARRRDNGEIVRPLTILVKSIEASFTITEWENFKQKLKLHGIYIPASALDMFEEEIAPEFPGNQIRVLLARAKEDLRCITDMVQTYKRKLNDPSYSQYKVRGGS